MDESACGSGRPRAACLAPAKDNDNSLDGLRILMEKRMQGSTNRGPLADFIVVDLTRFVAGPYCTMLLADHGATVIKVESPSGEESRAMPPTVGDGDVKTSLYFSRFNRNKSSICLDLRSARGLEVLRDLVRHADVLVENFRPGVMEAMGLDAPALHAENPRLIYCSISGFGHRDTPYRDRPAFAPIVESMAGLTRFNPAEDGAPLTMGLALGDLFPGALATAGITMALVERNRTGSGTHIDLAMYDAMLSLNERALLFSAMLGVNAHPGAVTMTSTPSGIFLVKDGFICLSVVGESIWERFCHVIGHEELLADPRLHSGPARAEVYEKVLAPVLDSWLGERTRRQAVRELIAGGVPAGEVMSPLEVLDDNQATSRTMLSTIPTYGQVDVLLPATPIRTGDSVARRCDPVPALGEHTAEILQSVLGYESSEIDDLIECGAVAGRH
jgi:CoA:oxalate CoA-transferase